jgi:hypothetical protein
MFFFNKDKILNLILEAILEYSYSILFCLKTGFAAMLCKVSKSKPQTKKSHLE